MSLTGISTTRRTPGTLREFILAAGPGSSGATHPVLIYGNKTSSGSETADNTIRTQVLDLQDCITRFGRRSEIRWLYEIFTKHDREAPIYVVAVPEGGGATASTRVLTFAAGAATVATVGRIYFMGRTTEYSVPLGATAVEQAAAFTTAFNNADEGSWMATAAIGGVGSEHIVTITGSQLGVRLNALFSVSLRHAYDANPTTTATFGAASAGATEDDFTSAYLAASAGEYTYQVNPKFVVTAPTSTDNGVGEGIAYIREQMLPANGKEQTMHFGFTGTQAQATTVAIDSDANSTYAYFYHAEDSDWTAGMLAAMGCGVTRLMYEGHPSENIAGYHNTDSTPMAGPPDPFDKTDRPTSAEIEADLVNGITPIGFTTNGDPYIVRHVTSYSEVSSGVKDYRAAEGHIPFAIFRYWEEFEARWLTEKQRGIADDPLPGQKPLPKTTTPSQVRGLAFSLIDDFAGPRPVGLYEGPILSPSPEDVAQMKASFTLSLIPGGFECTIDLLPLEHLLHSRVKVRGVGAAY